MRRWGLAATGPALDLAAVFGTSGPFVLDIGFGGGEALLELARGRPQESVIGVEVHTTGLVHVTEALAAEGIVNVRLVDGDALELLDRLAPGSLDEVRIYFPDPWPKHRQSGRRIVRADVVSDLTDRLRPGGVLHLATDAAEYVEQMTQVCAGEVRLTGGPVPRPGWRPVTRFEQRALAAGRDPVDLRYRRH